MIYIETQKLINGVVNKGGKVYIGKYGLDPLLPENKITVYTSEDTAISGFGLNLNFNSDVIVNGKGAGIYAKESYSLQFIDEDGAVYPKDFVNVSMPINDQDVENFVRTETDNEYREGTTQSFYNVKIKDIDIYPPSIEPLEVTVGSGGYFETINEARDYLTSGGANSSGSATIRLLTGFIMQEQVFCVGSDEGWIKIIADDSTVTINRSSLVNTYPDLDFNSTPAFLAIHGGVLPVIGALFIMDTSGDANPATQHGLMCAWGGVSVVARDAGIDNCTGRGLYGVNGSVYARNAFFRNSGVYGCRFGNGSIANIRGSDFSGAGVNGLHINSSVVAASDVIAANCVGSSLDVRGGASINATRSVFTGSANAVYLETGSVDIEDADLSGTLGDVIQATGGQIRALNANMSSSNGRCISINGPCYINASNADMTANSGDVMVSVFNSGKAELSGTTNSNNQNTINIGNGGQVNAGSIDFSSSETPNKLTSEGVIYSDTYITENSGVSQIVSGTSSVVVSHGLSYQPEINQFNVITNSSNGAAEGVTRVIDVDDTQFTIAINQAASNTVNYFWRIIP